MFSGKNGDCGINITALSLQLPGYTAFDLETLILFLQGEFNSSLATGFLAKEKVVFVHMEERILP